MSELIAMPLGHVKLAFAIGAMLLFVAGVADAQDTTVPMPDSSYGDSANNYQSPTDLPMPAADDQTNPDTVTIPIPGGGEVTVDGPDAPDEKGLPTLPGSQWGTQQLTPFSHGTGAVGP
jgi:hypothetical protein